MSKHLAGVLFNKQNLLRRIIGAEKKILHEIFLTFAKKVISKTQYYQLKFQTFLG